MTGIDDAALLAVVATASALGASALPRASWPRRSPAAAILLWQALGLASGLAAVGTLIGLALPASQGGLVFSVLRAAGQLRDGDGFGLARLFGLGEAPLAFIDQGADAAQGQGQQDGDRADGGRLDEQRVGLHAGSRS